MNYSRTLTPICCLLATALLAFAQTPTPRAAAAPPPPDAWEQTPAPSPRPSPRPAAAPIAPMPPMPPDAWDQTPMAPMPPMPPMPAMAPMAPMDIDLGDLDLQISMAKDLTLNPELQEEIEAAREQVGRMKFDLHETMVDREEMVAAAREMAMAAQIGKFGMAFTPQAITPRPAIAPMPPMPPKPMTLRGMSDDRAYSAGQSALDNRQWDDAVGCFNQVISVNGSRTDGALYWKAYALGRLGRRDEANAAIAELRKSFASSRWLDDAKALELELKQASGQNVSPEAENDEELKLMAINGLMQSDPERAIPLLEGLLKGSASPKVKRNTLFVLAQSNSPKAQALVEQIARGGANPDLQLKAISYMDQRRKPNNNAQVLAEIYAATNDLAVKRAILQAHSSIRDKDFLLHAAKTEKNPELRQAAINYLAGNNGTPELWQLYQTETTSEGKQQLLRYMYSNSNAEKLLEVVRTEKDPKVRADAMRVLASQRTGVDGNTMVQLYNAEQDQQIKMSIVDGLYSQRNAKALVDIARGEKDTKLKLRIVERLSNMKSKEAQDYLEELLKK
jgi:HEAT repeats